MDNVNGHELLSFGIPGLACLFLLLEMQQEVVGFWYVKLVTVFDQNDDIPECKVLPMRFSSPIAPLLLLHNDIKLLHLRHVHIKCSASLKKILELLCCSAVRGFENEFSVELKFINRFRSFA